MTEIIPNGKVYLLRGVKIDNTYENTIYFATEQDQYNYFISKCPNTSLFGFEQVNYQRVNAGVISIRASAERIMSCNYMMFQNSYIIEDSSTEPPSQSTATYGWVYAFITDVVYKSTACCEIHYEIDVLQTFHFRYQLGQCFVEREHTQSDDIGEHIIDEGLPIPDYEYTEMRELDDYSQQLVSAFSDDKNLAIVLCTTYEIDYSSGSPVPYDYYAVEYSGVFSGFVYHAWPYDDYGTRQCIQFIRDSGSKATDGIVSLFLAPSSFIYDYINPSITTMPEHIHELEYADAYQSFDGYTPKNNKMYTYPYNYLYVYNGCGNCGEYRFEKFEQTSGSIPSFKFKELLDFSCAPSTVILPLKYENIDTNTMEMLTCGPFPQLAWATDTYKAWIAQNSTSLMTSLLGSAFTTVSNFLGGAISGGIKGSAGGVAGTIIGAVTGGAKGASNSDLLSTVLNIYTQMQTAKKLPDQAHGNTNASQLMCCINEMHFHAYRRYIRKEYAKSIDEFFTLFGYKVNRIDVPLRTRRKEFTYIKTAESTIIPNASNPDNYVPVSYIDVIKQIYDNGVRWWRSGDNIGRYDLDNSPLTQGA